MSSVKTVLCIYKSQKSCGTHFFITLFVPEEVVLYLKMSVYALYISVITDI